MFDTEKMEIEDELVEGSFLECTDNYVHFKIGSVQIRNRTRHRDETETLEISLDGVKTIFIKLDPIWDKDHYEYVILSCSISN